MIASNVGIYRTTNAGVSWTQEQSGNFYDIEPNYGTSSNHFYASTSSSIYRSTNNGDTWSNIHTVSNSNRLALATSPANTSYLYVLSSGTSGGSNGSSGFNALIRSTDSGNSFSTRSTSPNILGYESNGSSSGGQGWYDLAFAMHPTNANEIYVGGVNNWKSTNGGTSWTIKSHWYGAGGLPSVHADKHALEFQGTTLWEGNDGGIYKTTNGGDSWTDLANGMVISQLYRIGVAQQNSATMCGLQDNGSKLKNGAGVWSDHIGGDGMESAIDPSNSNVLYGELYYGEIRRSTDGGGSWNDIQNNMPGNPSGAWVTPYEIDQVRPDTIVAGYEDVYRSFDKGSSWTKISNNLTGGTDLRYIRISESNPDYIYAGYWNSMWRTTNGGTTWEARTTPGTSVSTMIVHPNNPDSLWAVMSNYAAGQKVYVSADGGGTWTNISGSLPNIPANTIAYPKGTQNGIYVGLDIGVYYYDDVLSSWEPYIDNLPNVEITELEINYHDNHLYAATYGRGLWKTPLNTGVPLCFQPNNVMLDNAGAGSLSFSWSSPTSPPVSYEIDLTTSTTPPASGAMTTALDSTFTGLLYSNNYYFHIRSNCGADGESSWITRVPFKILSSCNATVHDSGGSGNNYSNLENNITVICPDSPNNLIEISFNSFNVENAWDALYIHDGPSKKAPLFDSGNGITLAGFPAGGYYGTSTPGPFLSTDPSGCLTLHFRSDEFVTRPGWNISVGCQIACATMVNVDLDEGFGSLRNVIDCNPNGLVINFDPSLIGDTIELSSQTIDIDNNYTFQNNGGLIYISSTIDGPMFNVTSNGGLTLGNFKFIPKPNTTVIENAGSLKALNLIIENQNNQLNNTGSIYLGPNAQLKMELSRPKIVLRV